MKTCCHTQSHIQTVHSRMIQIHEKYMRKPSNHVAKYLTGVSGVVGTLEARSTAKKLILPVPDGAG